LLAACAVAVLLVGTYTLDLDHRSVQTMVFTTLVFSQLLHAFSIRSRSATSAGWVRPGWLMIWSITGSALLQLLVVYTTVGNTFLKTAPIELEAMAWTAGLSVLSMVLVRLFNRFQPSNAPPSTTISSPVM
jgi:magnesium-transporting ATPase (P-type)